MDLPLNLQEREKYFLYSEMILQLQMARDHLLLQQSEKVSNAFYLEWNWNWVLKESIRNQFKVLAP